MKKNKTIKAWAVIYRTEQTKNPREAIFGIDGQLEIYIKRKDAKKIGELVKKVEIKIL